MGIFKYLEQVVKIQPFGVFKGAGVSKISKRWAGKCWQDRQT